MKRSEIREEIIDAMVVAILAEFVSSYTDLDPLDVGFDIDELVNALQEEQVEFADDPTDDIAEAWEEAYDSVVHGDGEYWREEYGMDYEEVGYIVDKNASKIERKVLSLIR